MKLAVVGAGPWGKNLCRVFNELGVLGMVCDPALPQHGYAVPDASFTRAMQDHDITAVAIATPAATHYDLALQALQAGKDVFVEKPMALSVHDGLALVSAAKAVDRMLMVGHLMEYHPAVRLMASMVDRGDLGAIEYIHSTRLANGRVREGESVLWSFAPHDVSMILHIMRDMPHVWADGDADSAIIKMAFTSGAQGHIWVNWKYPFTDRRLAIIGTKAGLIFYGGCDNLVVYNNGAPGGVSLEFDRTEPLLLECQAFVEACETRIPPLTDGASGIRVLSVLELAELMI